MLGLDMIGPFKKA
jgi:transposase InsO family protein